MSAASMQTMRQGVHGLERTSSLWERKVVGISSMSWTWSTLRQVVLFFGILMAQLLRMLIKLFIQVLMEMHGGTASNSSPRWRTQLRFSRQPTQTSRLFLFLINLLCMPRFHPMHWKPSTWTNLMVANNAFNGTQSSRSQTQLQNIAGKSRRWL